MQQDAHDPYAALRYRDYRCLLGGNVAAAMSSEALATVVGWELFMRTDSAAALGYAGLAQFLPVLVLALPAGQAADHFSRKYLLIAAQSMMLLTSLGLAALSFCEGPIPLVYGCLVLAGCGRALGMPARASLISMVVPVETMANAVTWSSSGWQVATVAGPALGGLLIAHVGDVGNVYLLTSLGFLTAITLFYLIRPRLLARTMEPLSLQSLLAGIRFVKATELLLAAITLDLFAVLLGGATALLPIFADKILEVGPTGLGWLRAAPGLGALVMAILMAHRPPLRHPGVALLGAVAGFGIATIGFGLSDNFYLSLLMLALTGALDNISVVVRGTLIQVLTPDSMRGRVSAVNAIFISTTNELGAFESGITAAAFGTIASVVGGGIGTLVVVLVVMAVWPRLTTLGPLHTIRPEGTLPPKENEDQIGSTDGRLDRDRSNAEIQ